MLPLKVEAAVVRSYSVCRNPKYSKVRILKAELRLLSAEQKKQFRLEQKSWTIAGIETSSMRFLGCHCSHHADLAPDPSGCLSVVVIAQRQEPGPSRQHQACTRWWWNQRQYADGRPSWKERHRPGLVRHKRVIIRPWRPSLNRIASVYAKRPARTRPERTHGYAPA